MRDSILKDKSKTFALEIIKLYRYLTYNIRETVLSKQILKSGTSIGANIREAYFAGSDADFIAKLNISLKEANETAYWLELLYESGFIAQEIFNTLNSANGELIAMLIASIKTTKERIFKKP